MRDEAPARRSRVATVVAATVDGEQSWHVANLAALLSCAGRRILVLDALARGGGVQHWLTLLPAVDITNAPEVRQRLPGADTDQAWRSFVASLRVTRRMSPVSGGVIDVVTLGVQLPSGHAATLLENAARVSERAPYDVVLVCGLGEFAAYLGSSLVICLGDTQASARAAGEAVRRFVAAANGQPTVPVVSGAPTETAAAADGPGPLRAAYAQAAGLDPAEVPRFLPVPAPDPASAALAVFTDPAAGVAYAALAVALGAADDVPPVPAAVSRRYRARLADDSGPERLWLVYPPTSRPWGEWLADALGDIGVPVEPVTDDLDPRALATRSVLVIGPVEHLPEPFRAHLAARPEAPEIIWVAVDRGTADSADGAGVLVDLTGTSEQMALTRLRALLFLGPAATGRSSRGRWRTRFPGDRTERRAVNLPPPNRRFVGLERELGEIRDALTTHGACLVTGEVGTGKRELTTAYAHRYAFDYDVVWWIRAYDPSHVRASLAELRGRIEQLSGVDTGDDPLAALTAGVAGPRWLLLYYNANNLDELSELFPSGGPGHVLVISRAGDAERIGALLGRPAVPRVALARLGGTDAVGLLTDRLPMLPTQLAEELRDRLRSVPLALHLASATLRGAAPVLLGQDLRGEQRIESAVRGYLAELETTNEPDAIGAALAVTLRMLDRHGAIGRVAIHLAKMCAFLSAEGVLLQLLRHRSMLDQLADLAGRVDADEFLRDSAVFETAVRQGVRYGLFEVDWGQGFLRMHPLLQRHLRTAMPPGESRAVRAAVQRGLARTTPTDASLENEAHTWWLNELRTHLEPTGAVESTQREVRRWVIKQVQSAGRYGDRAQRRAALRLADRAAVLWAAADPPDQLVRLDFERATLRWELGDSRGALELQEDAYQRAQRVLGPEHVRTLLAGRTTGRFLRGAGHFARARIADHRAYEGLRRALGEANPNTLWAANNLAFSTFLTGDARGAVVLERDALAHWVEQIGLQGRWPWRYLAAIGGYLRELGRYSEAGAELELAASLAERTGHGAADPRTVLRIGRHQAAIARLTGQPQRARQDDRRILRDLLARFGADDHETATCQLALGADESRCGDTQAGVALAEQAIAVLRRTLPPGHPYLFVAQTDLGALQVAARTPQVARDNTQEALAGLVRTIGEGHPWTLAATVNRLAALTDFPDEVDLPRELSRLATRCARLLGTHHPVTAIARANRNLPDAQETIIIDVPTF